MSVLVMLHAVNESTLIDGGIRIQLYARWNVTDGLQKPPQAGQTSVGLAGAHSFRDRREFLSVVFSCVAFIYRQKRKQLLVAHKRGFGLLDFSGRIARIQELGLNKFRQEQLEPLHIELKLEFLGVHAAHVDCADVAHRGDRKRGVERDKVLFGRTLAELEEAPLPS